MTYSVGETGAACEGGFGLVCFVHRGELPAECVLRALCVVRALRGLVREGREEDAVARVAKSASFVAASRVQAGNSFFYGLRAHFLHFYYESTLL